MTKAKSRSRFCCCSHAKEFKGIFMYSGVMNKCFQSTMDAVRKYRWDGSWKEGKVMAVGYGRRRGRRLEQVRDGSHLRLYFTTVRLANEAESLLMPTLSKMTSTISSSSWMRLSNTIPSPHVWWRT